ncbi:hypothetical protein [Nonomuraea ceibae]|uniref:hypothetical protein n=1 Tax=Nonomuraea ceibae TaxID=1935170 RepID=UPI001C5E98DC|nr:hypothetical protein [Nonomuraea ceibae]
MAGLAVDVDVLPAQVAGQVRKAAVAGQQRGLVQRVRPLVQRVNAGADGGVGNVGDLLDPFGKR